MRASACSGSPVKSRSLPLLSSNSPVSSGVLWPGMGVLPFDSNQVAPRMSAEPQVPENRRSSKQSAQAGAVADMIDRPGDAIRLRFIDRAPAKIEPYLRLM